MRNFFGLVFQFSPLVLGFWALGGFVRHDAATITQAIGGGMVASGAISWFGWRFLGLPIFTRSGAMTDEAAGLAALLVAAAGLVLLASGLLLKRFRKD